MTRLERWLSMPGRERARLIADAAARHAARAARAPRPPRPVRRCVFCGTSTRGQTRRCPSHSDLR